MCQCLSPCHQGSRALQLAGGRLGGGRFKLVRMSLNFKSKLDKSMNFKGQAPVPVPDTSPSLSCKPVVRRTRAAQMCAHRGRLLHLLWCLVFGCTAPFVRALRPRALHVRGGAKLSAVRRPVVDMRGGSSTTPKNPVAKDFNYEGHRTWIDHTISRVFASLVSYSRSATSNPRVHTGSSKLLSQNSRLGRWPWP